MPEEIEVPTEHLHESLEEHAEEHAHDHPHKKKHHGEKGPAWIPGVALSAAVMAVCAAIAALLAGHHANEGILDQITASDRWSLFQAKGIKASVLNTKVELLTELQKTPKPEDVKKIEDYAAEQKTIQAEANELEHSSQDHMSRHSILARTVTFFQVAIALAAIAVLSRKKWLWYASLALAAGGSAVMVQSFL
jgi:hypothetical protein